MFYIAFVQYKNNCNHVKICKIVLLLTKMKYKLYNIIYICSQNMYLISLSNNEIELFYLGVVMLLYKTIFYGLLLITKYMLFLSLLI